MDQLQAIGTVPDASEARLSATRALLVEAASSGRGHEPGRHRAPRRVLSMVAALAVVSGGSFAAWQLVSRTVDPSTMTTIECGADTYVPVETADPVLACHDALARLGGTVPPLTGWVTPSGLIDVLPTGATPPVGSTRLPSHFQVDTGVRFVTDALGDEVGPLATGCLSPSAATSQVASDLALAGLPGWHVALSSGTTTFACPAYVGAVDASTRTVSLDAVRGGTVQGTAPDVRLDELLHDQLVAGTDARCASTADATALATRDAAHLGIPASALTVSDGGRLGASGSTCATPFLVPGGFVDVVLWQTPAP